MLTVRDPGLEDMLSEPMIVRLMASDRIRAEDARALYAEIADRLRDRGDRHTADVRAANRAVRPEGIVYA
jgi:hypothetical protein